MCSVQAHFAAGHPAAQSSTGGGAQHAELPGRVARGSPSGSAELRPRKEKEKEKRKALLDNSVVCGRGSICPGRRLLSPTGSAAACVWTDVRRWRNEHLSSGVRMACVLPEHGDGQWLTPLPDVRDPATWGHTTYG